MNNIHKTAIIDPKAIIGKNNDIGPYCIVGPHIRLGDNNILHSSVVLDGITAIGNNNAFYHSAVIGSNSQDLKYKGEPTCLNIGNNNTFREFCTVNKSATMDEDTSVADNCLLMAYSHIAHNCHIGSNVIIANAVNLAGHIHINDFVTIGGMTALHQFVKVGIYSFIGGKSGVKKDIPPFTRGEGMPYQIHGLNSVGLMRRGFSKDQIAAIKNIFKLFYKSGLNVSQAMIKAEEMVLTDEQEIFIQFIREAERGITK